MSQRIHSSSNPATSSHWPHGSSRSTARDVDAAGFKCYFRRFYFLLRNEVPSPCEKAPLSFPYPQLIETTEGKGDGEKGLVVYTKSRFRDVYDAPNSAYIGAPTGTDTDWVCLEENDLQKLGGNVRVLGCSETTKPRNINILSIFVKKKKKKRNSVTVNYQTIM